MRILASPLLLICLLSTGCTYVCHDYDPVTLPLKESGWQVTGDIERWRPAYWESGPGLWPHWAADKDDRYQLVLKPAVADSAFWLSGDVDFVNVRVIAGQDTIAVFWTEKSDIADGQTCRPTYSQYKYKGSTNPPWADPRIIGFGKYEFTSEFFFLAPPVPDVLYIQCDLLRLDKEGQEIARPLPVRAEMIIFRHRRWHIADAFES